MRTEKQHMEDRARSGRERYRREVEAFDSQVKLTGWGGGDYGWYTDESESDMVSRFMVEFHLPAPKQRSRFIIISTPTR